MLRLKWYHKRLASMSASEIWHRILEQTKRIISRFHKPNFAEEYKDSSPLPKFPNNTFDLNNIQSNEKLLQKWRDLAEKVNAKQFRFLGIEWPDDIKNNIWHFDPITKKQWPSNSYCFQINYRNTKEYGDVKYVWELNRLQYLQPLAALAAIENNENLSIYCLKTIENWIDSNPPYKGINWASGIELACRAVSILVVMALLVDNLVTKQQKNKITNSLAHHGYWLMRYPSRFSSANNHLIAEAAALFLLGKLAPNLPYARAWKKYGKNILIKEVTKQIYEDGVGAEQSPTYTAFTVEWLLLCGIVGNKLDDKFPKKYWDRIEKSGEFIHWITDNHGNQPHIGDDDEGQVLFSQFVSTYYATSILSCIANTTERHDLSAPIHVPHLRELFFSTPKYNYRPLHGIKCFKQGGYTVSRTYINNNEYLLTMDHGPLGYLSIAAHGHADALSIWFHINGFPVLVDAGTYLYHSGGCWRNHMRGTMAHNTLSINNQDSSQISGPFNWKSKASCSLITYNRDNKQLTLCAEHDGYKQKFKVSHRRIVEQNSDGSFVVKDSLHGLTNKLPVTIGFLFHPELSIFKQDQSWIVTRNNKPLLEIEDKTSYFKSSIKLGNTKPVQGWYSEAFGHKTAAPRLVFDGMLKTEQESIILFRPKQKT